MKTHILPLVGLFLSGCCSTPLIKISRELGKIQGDNTGIYKKKTFHDVRKLVIEDGRKDFFDLYDSDTLFIIESFSIETGNYYGQLIKRGNVLGYLANMFNDQISYKTENIFSKYKIQLVKSWDTTAIREDEEKFPISNHVHSIYASRIIKEGDVLRYDVFKFMDFFNPEQERFQ